jgi:GAF domain-containing protein
MTPSKGFLMTESNERSLLIARTLGETLKTSDLATTLESLTRAAVQTLPGVDHASISVRHSDGTIESYAMTDDFLEELDRGQYDNQEGPCYDGVTNNVVTVCGDLRTDPRYPNYGPQAVAAGIRSQAGIRLFEARRSTGALNLYSRTVGALADVAFLVELFTEHAKAAITHAREMEDLRQAMISRQLIGQCVGVLMERYQLSADRAFAFLARVSQDRNVKLRLVAEEILAMSDAGQLEEPDR